MVLAGMGLSGLIPVGSFAPALRTSATERRMRNKPCARSKALRYREQHVSMMSRPEPAALIQRPMVTKKLTIVARCESDSGLFS
jgi:hypothetical protein